MKKRILAMILCIALCVSLFVGCGSKGADAFVIMTEQLDGLFNPFFYTSAPDGTIVSMTQISMLGAAYKNGEVEVAYGEDEAVVVKDYEIVENKNDTTTYTFVLKNVFCKVKTTCIGVNHSCTTKNTRNNYKKKFFVLKEKF